MSAYPFLRDMLCLNFFLLINNIIINTISFQPTVLKMMLLYHCMLPAMFCNFESF